MNRRKVLLLMVLILIVITLAFYSCEKAPETKPPPQAPVSNVPSGAAPVEPALAAPPLKTDIAKALPTGMKPGERYHDIHATRLNLQCETCHVKQAETYFDPLAQVTNPVDKRACLSCHTEGSVQPFYGASWDKASVKK